MASLLKMLTPVTLRAYRAGGRMGLRMALRGKTKEAGLARGIKMGTRMANLPRARFIRNVRRGLLLGGAGGYVGYRQYKKRAATK